MGESIIIGDDINVKIMDITRGSVRLGIAAPPDVIIDREEIREKRNSSEWDDDHGNR